MPTTHSSAAAAVRSDDARGFPVRDLVSRALYREIGALGPDDASAAAATLAACGLLRNEVTGPTKSSWTAVRYESVIEVTHPDQPSVWWNDSDTDDDLRKALSHAERVAAATHAALDLRAQERAGTVVDHERLDRFGRAWRSDWDDLDPEMRVALRESLSKGLAADDAWRSDKASS